MSGHTMTHDLHTADVLTSNIVVAKHLQKIGSYSASISLCDSLIADNTANPELYYINAFSYYLQGNLEKSIEYLDKSISLNPNELKYLELYALLAYNFGEMEKVIELLTYIISIENTNYYCWLLLAKTLLECGKPEDARIASLRALDIKSDDADAYFTSAEIALALGQPNLASKGYDEGLAKIPHLDMHHAARRIEIAFEAEDSTFIEKNIFEYFALEFHEDSFFRILNIYLQYLQSEGRFEEAKNILNVIDIRIPSLAKRTNKHRAWLLMACGDIVAAKSLYQEQIVSNPLDAGARFQLALCQMACGEISDGFKNYEARWRGSTTSKENRIMPMPLWTGECLNNKSILIWGEQGIGDQLRFASLIQYMDIEDAKHIRIECSPKLVNLFKTAYPNREIVTLLNSHRSEYKYNNFDYHIPMGSLPLIFGAERFLGRTLKPWLPSDIKSESFFRQKFMSNDNERIVGLCWRSGLLNRRRQLNYLTVSCLHELSFEENVRFVILQHDATEKEIEYLRDNGFNIIWPREINQRDDLISTRNLIGACDLVISVNCSVCDLAGSIGVPTILITPVKTWITFGHHNNPWHPNCVCTYFEYFNQQNVITDVRHHMNRSFNHLSWQERPRALCC